MKIFGTFWFYMKSLTRRQQEYLSNLLDLCYQEDAPIHYSTVAECLGVGNVTAYEMMHLMEIWRVRFPDLVAWMEETIEEPLGVFVLPPEYRKRMRTTNGLERFHEELRSRSRVVRIFPNRASCFRLSTGLAMEQSRSG